MQNSLSQQHPALSTQFSNQIDGRTKRSNDSDEVRLMLSLSPRSSWLPVFRYNDLTDGFYQLQLLVSSLLEQVVKFCSVTTSHVTDVWTFGNQIRQGFDSVLIQDSIPNQVSVYVWLTLKYTWALWNSIRLKWMHIADMVYKDVLVLVLVSIHKFWEYYFIECE